MAKLDWQNPKQRNEMAAKQIGRLAQMQGYPKWDEEALDELVGAMATAGSEEQARDCVNSILDAATTEMRCPMPAEIRGMLAARKPRTIGCGKCDQTGWVIVERGGLSGAAPCECHPASRKAPAPEPTSADPRKITEMKPVGQVLAPR